MRPVGGDEPEGIADQAIPHRGVPLQARAAPGRLQQRESSGRDPCAQREPDQPVIARSSVVTTRYFRDLICRFYRRGLAA